jgi:hypothetical protein
MVANVFMGAKGRWVAGLAIGLVFALVVFRGRLIVGLIFGIAIGVAFALAFGARRPERKPDRESDR